MMGSGWGNNLGSDEATRQGCMLRQIQHRRLSFIKEFVSDDIKLVCWSKKQNGGKYLRTT